MHFDYQPVLKGELVELRPLRADDYGALFAVALDATYARSGDLIGSSRYHGYDANRSEIEIGRSFLARSHWGGTYTRTMER